MNCSMKNRLLVRLKKEPLIEIVSKEFTPRTSLGRKLIMLRKRAIKAGMKLLTADEVLEVVKRCRGELEHDEEDVY